MTDQQEDTVNEHDEAQAQPESFRIPQANWPEFQRQMTKLSQKAAKLEVEGEPIGYRILAQEDVPLVHSIVRDYAEMPIGYQPNEAAGESIIGYRHYFIIEVTGERPHLNGWTFVATIQPAGEAGNIVRTVPGSGELPEQFRTTDLHCDHCQTIRYRKEIYVVRHDDGSYKQVGTNCLADFIGGKAPETVARWAQYLALAGEYANESTSGGSGVSTYSLREYVSIVAAVMRWQGWMPRGRARDEGGVATADDALTIMTETRGHIEAAGLAHIEVTDKDREEADAALAWAETLQDRKEDLNDYMWNLMVVTSSEYMPVKSAGLAASVINAYRRDREQEERRQEREARPESVHIGTVGEKIQFTAKVVFQTEVQSHYGSSTLYKMITTDGNDITWFCSGMCELTTGETYEMSATVKKHDEYQGRKQTVVTRARVIA